MIKRLTGIHVHGNVKKTQHHDHVPSHTNVVDDALIAVAASVHAIQPAMLLGILSGLIC
jgi:hypothetical protein